ncbi:hypothetical protein J7T55_005100 [Diaporthe amygdali]|uniref:uncharacterized protein n=1 Tax=Phomopsis amygdali TaxID=1214568 RepID=UPI0022FF1E6C|nr:uncharacterized protein J7T55_005100 [Diaporthe amygdali]KAJ0116154.1 hypothetical protein J7T55_005100 [Diaporthe amygdali]
MNPSRVFVSVTARDLAAAFTNVPAISVREARSSPTTSKARPESLVKSGLEDVSSLGSLDNELNSSQGSTVIAIAPYAPHASTSSTTQPSPFSSISKTAPTLVAKTSPPSTKSARTTGIIIGSVFGGLALLLMVTLAVVYVAWRRRHMRRDETGTEEAGQRRSKEVTDGPSNISGKPKPSTDDATAQSLHTAASITLRSQPIIVDATSPISPILPHLSRWTSEKADILSPVGHPAIPPHLQNHPLFATTAQDQYHQDGPQDRPSHSYQHDGDRPGSSSAAAALAPEPPSFLFDSLSSRSSRRSSTHDSSAPRTALSMPPRRRHTKAGGQGGEHGARSRRGSTSSASGGGGGLEGLTRPHTPPPPLPVRSAARSRSLHCAEGPGTWI